MARSDGVILGGNELMKDYVSEIVGKTVSSVILRKRRSNNPRCQLLVSFEGGGYFEFYCPDDMIKPTRGICSGDAFENPPSDGTDVIRVGHRATNT